MSDRRPAAAVILMRPASSGSPKGGGAGANAAAPVEIFLVRRAESLDFLGGFHAFVGGTTETVDGDIEIDGRVDDRHTLPFGAGA